MASSFDLANDIRKLFRETEHAIRGRDTRRLAVTRRAIKRVIYSSDSSIRNDQVVLDHKEELEMSARKITRTLFRLNKERVRECIDVTTGFVDTAECILNNPSGDARGVVRTVTWAIASAHKELNDLEVRPHLQIHLAPFSGDIKRLRYRLSQIASQNTVELTETRMATLRREEAERRESAEELEAQQAVERERKFAERIARARQKREEKARVVAQQSEYARTALAQFEAAIKNRDFEEATSAYNFFASYAKYGSGVYATCLGRQDPEMYFGRMRGMMRTLKDDEVGATKVRDLVG